MKTKIAFVFFLILFVSACTHTTYPLQPGDAFYNAKLKVKNTYVVPPTFWRLGFTFPATDYTAYMKDEHGIFFSAPAPIAAKDPILGTVFRTGGLYYQLDPSKQVSYYLVDTSTFAGVYVSKDPMTGLNYKIEK